MSKKIAVKEKPVLEELDVRAKKLRERIVGIQMAPHDMSVNQLREMAIMEALAEAREEGREKALHEEIYAVGKTPEEAIERLSEFNGWGKVTKVSPLEGGDEKYTWGRRFCAGGTGFKAAGWEVPGGVVVTWWK